PGWMRAHLRSREPACAASAPAMIEPGRRSGSETILEFAIDPVHEIAPTRRSERFADAPRGVLDPRSSIEHSIQARRRFRKVREVDCAQPRPPLGFGRNLLSGLVKRGETIDNDPSVHGRLHLA